MRTKRIAGIGTAGSGWLRLTQDCTKRAGYLLAEGFDGGDGARKVRAEIARVAEEQARAQGRTVEVSASKRGAQGWIVDVVTVPS